MVEHFLGKEEVTGSIPVVGSENTNLDIVFSDIKSMVKVKRPVAQLAEQRSPKPQVAGSSPSWPARWFSKPWRFLKEACMEVSKISWPTWKEVRQTALVVGIVVLFISLFLWAIDISIFYMTRGLIGQKG